MKKQYQHEHEMLTAEDVESNKEEMMSYSNMRDVLLPLVKSARGQKKIYLTQILDVLDLSCEIALHSDNQQEIEAEIYAILS